MTHDQYSNSNSSSVMSCVSHLVYFLSLTVLVICSFFVSPFHPPTHSRAELIQLLVSLFYLNHFHHLSFYQFISFYRTLLPSYPPPLFFYHITSPSFCISQPFPSRPLFIAFPSLWKSLCSKPAPTLLILITDMHLPILLTQ